MKAEGTADEDLREILSTCINVGSIDKLRAFYLAALKPLGYKVKTTFLDGEVVGIGADNTGVLWLAGPNAQKYSKSDFVDHTHFEPQLGVKTGPMELGFGAKNKDQVHKFYEAAIAAGGTCNGPPGLRMHMGLGHVFRYGALVMDPEGRRIEAVCMKPEVIEKGWGLLGWSAAGLVLATVGGGIGMWLGWFPKIL